MITPKTLTEKESIDFITGMSRDRDRLLALIMLDTGLRVGELVQLLKSDLFTPAGPVKSLYVRPEIAKGRRSRFIPLTARLEDLIGQFYGTLGPANSSNFPGLSKRQVERIMKSTGMKTIHRPVNPHMLRHTFATRMMRITNARVVQQLLGHRKLTSTQIYTHPNADDLASAIARLDPKM